MGIWKIRKWMPHSHTIKEHPFVFVDFYQQIQRLWQLFSVFFFSLSFHYIRDTHGIRLFICCLSFCNYLSIGCLFVSFVCLCAHLTHRNDTQSKGIDIWTHTNIVEINEWKFVRTTNNSLKTIYLKENKNEVSALYRTTHVNWKTMSERERERENKIARVSVCEKNRIAHNRHAQIKCVYNQDT